MKKLSVVIPVYNEEQTIEEIIRRVLAVDVGLEKEIIVVDDCSQDGTREILERLSSLNSGDTYPISRKLGTCPQNLPQNLKVYFHEKNSGKGASLRTGFSHASGDIILIQDADLEYDPREYLRMLEPILDGRADAVYGSRFLGGPHRVLFFWHYLGNRLLTLFSNMMANLNLTDMETCYKVMKRDLLKKIKIKSNRFGFEPEITLKLAKLKARIYEVPISYSGRDYSEGKKIGWKDGVAAIFHILRFKFFK